jgi:hypothetical protein
MLFFRFLLFVSVLITCSGLLAQQFNRPVPPGVARYVYHQHDSSCYGFLLAAPVNIHPTRPGNGDYVEPQVILDGDGFLLWYGDKEPTVLNTDFKYHPAHKQFSYCAVKDSVTYIRYILDHKLRIIDSVVNLGGVLPDSHDFLILPDGNYLVTGRLYSIADLSGTYFDRVPGSKRTKLLGLVIQVINRKHELVWQWNSNEHINPAEFVDSYGYDSTMFDYCHGNSVSVANDGNYLVSFRNMDAVYKIDKNTGKTIWVMGGESGSFSFTNDNGFSGQHHVLQLPNGNVTVYNNGNSLVPKRTEAIEYKIDTQYNTASYVWKARLRPGFYSQGMGSFQTCRNGNRLIGYGQVHFPDPAIQLMDSTGKLLFEILYENEVMSYRSYLMEDTIRWPRPTIRKASNGDAITLTAPAGFKKYKWNTGETTRTITVFKPGRFVVWVNYGNGMLGSLPVVVTRESFAK